MENKHYFDSDKMIALAVDDINGMTEQEQQEALLSFICSINALALSIPRVDPFEDIVLLLEMMLNDIKCNYRGKDVLKQQG